ncbi:glycosyl transferase family group 2-domain-containing protein [Microdochium trichocladiopsis]|uniref:Glycosyl transferase family group 2-domain-containing protein n=1 Tax=Microdochium trichocladiopsis TaxID=1682393 RepID=A0A9P8YA36_9PEZI|nr:glycosyl transferase family group 2-domain-containing protein [Microdochium trichocladiopsis]KAH7031440.1 glycosyl transferase family group 2-domain-containing protein [Microdochium trichocladiopsis]
MAETTKVTMLPAPAPVVIKGSEPRRRLGPSDSMTQVLARYLHRRIIDAGWIRNDTDAKSGPSVPGMVIKSEDGSEYVTEPSNTYPELMQFCQRLNITAAFTMSCELTDQICDTISAHEDEITLPSGITVPIVQSLRHLATTDRSVRMRDLFCLVKQERCLVIWSQTADGLFEHAADVEEGCMTTDVAPTPTPGGHHVMTGAMHTRETSADLEKWKANQGFRTPEIDEMSELDAEEKANLGPRKRPFVLTHSVLAGIAVCLLVITQSLNVRQIIIEVKALGSVAYDRIAMAATVPIFAFFSIFFFSTLVTAAFQLIGPMQDIKTGCTRFYSSIKPDHRKHGNIVWPHITIQMPVYKEGLKGVIQPTINSLLPAIEHYNRLGGTANIFICEDGMQLVSDSVREMRTQFYRQHDIGWVARPGHGKDGFVRGGRFKKASNMNYCLDFSLRVEDRLLQMIADEREARGFTNPAQQLEIEEEEQLYEAACREVIEGDQGKTMAEGNVRIGEIILLIDSDTRVPVDCLSLAAMEMEESPEVAIIQHASGVMNVTNSWFENAITYFTNLIYAAIRFSVGNGDVAPFIGHNAFLRWKAIQSIKFTSEDGRELFWSENHVSEDFDVALRLQAKGFVLRLATYDKGEFKEGVSLTVMDELLRWEKYSYGCSELLFNPFYQWIYKGPFASMFYRMIFSNLKTTSKFTIIGYMGTYFAIACSLPLSLANYFIVGWLTPDLDAIYTDSWKIMVGCIVVFQGISPVCFAIYRHRVGDMPFWKALYENLKWYWFFIIFFSGISWHLSYSLLAHLLCLPIEWSSTVKELESTGFFIGLDNVTKYYKYSTAFSLAIIGAMIYLSQFAPSDWVINSWLCIVPLAMQVAGHLLMPILSIVY